MGFLETNFMDKAIENLYKLHKEDSNNSLILLCLSTCFLQLVTARITSKKEDITSKAIYYFQLYK